MDVPATINRDVLATLPLYVPAPGHRLQDGSGNGCYLDAPGYPTYYTRSVYTPRGDSPSRGATLVLFGRVMETAAEWEDGDTWETRSERQAALFRSLYLPLPFDHPRVTAWMGDLFRHFRDCYEHPTEREHGRPKIMTPSSVFKAYAPASLSLGHQDVKGKTPEEVGDLARATWAAKLAAYDQAKAQERATWAALAIPERHVAVRHVQAIYPEYVVDAETVAHPPAPSGDWYTTLEERPTPETCPGETRWAERKPHPFPGPAHCQVCGWRS